MKIKTLYVKPQINTQGNEVIVNQLVNIMSDPNSHDKSTRHEHLQQLSWDFQLELIFSWLSFTDILGHYTDDRKMCERVIKVLKNTFMKSYKM